VWSVASPTLFLSQPRQAVPVKAEKGMYQVLEHREAPWRLVKGLAQEAKEV
jgi:hypothetical protein